MLHHEVRDGHGGAEELVPVTQTQMSVEKVNLPSRQLVGEVCVLDSPLQYKVSTK